MRTEAVATVATEETAEASRSSQQQGIGGLLCEYLNIMKEKQQESLVRQPESAKIDNPIYRGCSTKIDNDLGLEAFPEIELFDSHSN